MNPVVERIRRFGTEPVAEIGADAAALWLPCYCKEVFGEVTDEQRLNIYHDLEGRPPGSWKAWRLADIPSIVLASVCPVNGWLDGGAVLLEHMWITPDERGVRNACSLVRAVFDWAEQEEALCVYASGAKGPTSLLESASRKAFGIYEIEV